ncbi:MAG: hypothetical protein ACYTG0_46575 [Planctomycetota bacterium]|jgi:hypothetical protein
MTKRATTTFVVFAVLLACGISYAADQKGPPPNEHLKCYSAFIGTWRYEGPLLEDVPDVAEKGSKFVLQISWKWILDKNVVESAFTAEFENGEKLAGKGLIGWNAAEKQIVTGGMNTVGGISLGTITYDRAAKSLTAITEGINGDGEETSFKGVVTKTGKDTLTWQRLEGVGGIVEGESPVYKFERVKRGKRAKQPATK